jgi:hypothetical protein
MRLVIESDRMPLPQRTELRARLDRYGHVLVWPDDGGYRVVAPGTLRAIFEELRADVSPLQAAKTERAGGGKLLGLPVNVDTIQTAMGTLVLEQAQIGDLGESGILLCRLLSELVLAAPDNAACRRDWVPLKAEFGWADAGRFGFLVSGLERVTDLKTNDFLMPPEKGSFRDRQLPDKAVSVNAVHITGKSMRSGASGMRRPNPRSRSERTALQPESVASPIVWQKRIVG